jgi:hypothetical protein
MENITNSIQDIKLSKSKNKKPVINYDKELPTINKSIYNLDYINTRINTEICNETITKLKDDNLIDDYKKCKSVINAIEILSDILTKNNINATIKENILSDYLIKLIPAGTKGVIRGNKFNSIVKETIENIKLDEKRFEICFEKQCEISITTEKPDWYILEKETGKVIIGMNQLDLWGGGQQTNRGSKYLIDNQVNKEKSKLVCVVCNKINFNNNKNKAYKLFEIGYKNNTLCYIKNIENIIKTYFN